MKMILADSLPGAPVLDILGGPQGKFQSPIQSNLIQYSSNYQGADAVLIPHDAKVFSGNQDYLEYLRALSKTKMLIFSDRGDFPVRPKISNAIALRVALQPFEKCQNLFIVPYNIESLSYLPFRKYRSIPRVAFMGLVPRNTLGRKFKTFISAPLAPVKGNGAATRRKYLKVLSQTSLDFVQSKREFYGAFAAREFDIMKNREEYIAFLETSDFFVAPRGDTNQSMRFFETLSSGRLALLPDTRVQLPSMLPKTTFPFALFTDFNSDRIERSVWSFWNTLNHKSYFNLQINIRSLFTEYLDFNQNLKQMFSLNLSDFLKYASVKSFKN